MRDVLLPWIDEEDAALGGVKQRRHPWPPQCGFIIYGIMILLRSIVRLRFFSDAAGLSQSCAFFQPAEPAPGPLALAEFERPTTRITKVGASGGVDG
jgi:hypothetical protein